MINSLGGEQDNVVFMGRRSFRMEIAGGPHSNELAIPTRASGIPTEKIFEADRGREEWMAKAAAATAALQPSRLRSSGTWVMALSLTTFLLGIALTLTLNGRRAPGRAPVVAPTPIAAPAIAPTTPAEPAMVIQPMPIAAPTDAEIMTGFALAPARKAQAKSARAARPRPLRAARAAIGDEPSDDAATSADPFADPTPTAKPAAAKPAAKTWVDPFAE